MWKDEIFAKALLISLWPFLLLWHLHSTCCILLTSPLLRKIPPFLNCPTFCPPACSLLNGVTGCQCLHLLLIDLVLTLKFLHPSSFYGQTGRLCQHPCSSALEVTVIHRVPSMNAEHMPGTHPTHTESSTLNLQGAWIPLLRQIISLSPSSCLCIVFKPFPKISSTCHYCKLR